MKCPVAAGSMLIELIAACVFFGIMITTVVGWQCHVLTALAELKVRTALLRSVTDRVSGDRRELAHKRVCRIFHEHRSLHISSRDQQLIDAVVGSCAEYAWGYDRLKLVLAMPNKKTTVVGVA